jgi:Helix-turn-helix domain
MIRVEIQKWGQSLDDLRRLALQAGHPRTRERFLALSLIADGTHNATSWAAQFGRQDDTVLKWVHDYNAQGPDVLTYRRTGGPAPLLRPTRPGSSSRPSPPPSRSTTACPATAGR